MNEQTASIRKALGTLSGEAVEPSYEIVKGCTRLRVEMIAKPENPYRQIVEAALQTWGASDSKTKWEQLTPAARVMVCVAALSGNALPLALETSQFQFRVTGIPRWAFDQIARSRIGYTFFSIGVRDNAQTDRYIILHPKEYNDETTRSHIEVWWKITKDLYQSMIKDKEHSWQNARDVLPMSLEHQFGFSANFLALKSNLARRLAFCEGHCTVGWAWETRRVIEEEFPLLSNWIRPACDFAGKCLYQKSYYLSNAFGMLFSSCGRHLAPPAAAEFNEAATDQVELEKELGFEFPPPGSYVEASVFSSLFKSEPEKVLELVSAKDAKYFLDNY
jgi:thymidylate synthase ThyX